MKNEQSNLNPSQIIPIAHKVSLVLIEEKLTHSQAAGVLAVVMGHIICSGSSQPSEEIDPAMKAFRKNVGVCIRRFQEQKAKRTTPSPPTDPSRN